MSTKYRADGLVAGLETPALDKSKLWSQAIVERAKRELCARAADLDGIETIAAGGSLGRLEASPDSDFDALIVNRSGIEAERLEHQFELIMEIVTGCGLRAPKQDGIYRSGVTREQLLAPAAAGSLTESPAVFGKRMQFLLDARALFRPQACERLQSDIVGWYGGVFQSRAPAASWTLLINDLSRYLHAYAGWQQFKFERSAGDSWCLRQAKLRSSRMLTFAGLMFLLGASNHRADKQLWLCRRLQLTPLQRVMRVMHSHDPGAAQRLLGAYEITHAMLSDAAVRQALISGGPDAAECLDVPAGAGYERLHDASSTLMHTLTQFLLDRSGDWDARFFTRLLF